MNVLYELKFDFTNLAPCLITFVLGLGFTFNRVLAKSKWGENSYKVSENARKAFIFLGVVLLIGSVLLSSGFCMQYFALKSSLDRDDVSEVEGVVEQFHAELEEEHNDEHFVINGVYFEYSEFESRTGYHKSKSYGGVIKGNGQKLKIKYVGIDEGYENNTILYIEEID